MKEKSNVFNTCGVVNVGLVFEDKLIPSGLIDEDYEWLTFAKKVVIAFDKMIDEDQKKEWNNEANKVGHLTAYRRIQKAINQWIQGQEERD